MVLGAIIILFPLTICVDNINGVGYMYVNDRLPLRCFELNLKKKQFRFVSYFKTEQYFGVLTTVEMLKKTSDWHNLLGTKPCNFKLAIRCLRVQIYWSERNIRDKRHKYHDENLMDFNMRYLSDGKWKFIAKNFSRFISEINATRSITGIVLDNDQKPNVCVCA